MRFFIFLAILGMAAVLASAQGQEQKADTSSANQAVFADINIFSQLPLGSILILWSNLNLEADIVRQITTRSFVLEPYFMQNIDREEFEKNQILHLFAEQKREFFKLFPDEEED
jgi:choline-glycine betaine transporter